MQSQWKGQRDERRRRVLLDEQSLSAGPATSPSASRAANRSSDGNAENASRRPYGDDVLRGRQLRVTDLLPIRIWKLALLFVMSMTSVAALIALHVQVDDWSPMVGRENLAAIDMSQAGSLASWFSTMVLAVASVGSLLVYAIRRHRTDDYRGRYRAWMWTSVALMAASLSAGTNLHLAIRGVLVRVTGMSPGGDGSLWWMMLYAVVFGALGVRIMIEMRRCRSALVASSLAALAYALAIAATLTGASAAAVHQIGQAASLLLGHVGALVAVCLYARYVILEAQGQLAVRPAKPKPTKIPQVDDGDKNASSGPEKHKKPKAEKQAVPQKAQDKPETKSTADATKRRKKQKSPAAQPASKSTAQLKVVADHPADAKQTQPTQPQSASKSKSNPPSPSKKSTSKRANNQPSKPVPSHPRADDSSSEEENDQPQRLSKSERRNRRKQQRAAMRRAA